MINVKNKDKSNSTAPAFNHAGTILSQKNSSEKQHPSSERNHWYKIDSEKKPNDID